LTLAVVVVTTTVTGSSWTGAGADAPESSPVSPSSSAPPSPGPGSCPSSAHCGSVISTSSITCTIPFDAMTSSVTTPTPFTVTAPPPPTWTEANSPLSISARPGSRAELGVLAGRTWYRRTEARYSSFPGRSSFPSASPGSDSNASSVGAVLFWE